MKKKIVAILLAACVAVLAAGCQREKNTSKDFVDVMGAVDEIAGQRAPEAGSMEGQTDE